MSTALKFLGAGWFAVVMGLSGLAMAWLRATRLLGDLAGGVALVLALLAGTVLVVLLLAYGLRASRFPAALQEDLRHPVRHPMVAALPLSLLLLAALGVALLGAQPWLAVLWVLGAVGQIAASLWVLWRWTRVAPPPRWPGVTPALLLPAVGHVLTPLAGAPLGFEVWSLVQFGVGVVMWPVVTALLVRRIAVAGMWPQRMLASTFITVVPASVIGMVALQAGIDHPMVTILWGVALLFLLWSARYAQRMVAQAFSMAQWGLSFPLAAFTSFTLRLGETQGGAMQAVALALLALSTLVIAILCLATLKGLRDGTVLVAEPVATIQPAP